MVCLSVVLLVVVVIDVFARGGVLAFDQVFRGTSGGATLGTSFLAVAACALNASWVTGVLFIFLYCCKYILYVMYSSTSTYI